MKKTSSLFLFSLLFSLSCLFYFEPSKAQTESAPEDLARTQPMRFSEETGKLKQVPQMVKNSASAGAHFDQRKLFQSVAKTIADNAPLNEVLSDGVVLDLNRPDVENILEENVDFLSLPLPDGKGGTIELQLVKADIFAPGFTVKTSEPTTEPIDESLGIHYRGIVKGNDHSLAAISIFRNEVLGFYSTASDGNSVLGRLGGNNPANKHILYAEKDLKVSSNFHCDTKDEGVTLPRSVLQAPDEVTARCLRIYLEANYDLFLNKGSVASTTSYLTGMFNQAAALYSNEGIPILISQIFVWTSTSPYTGTTAFEQLELFRAFRASFTGDLAHLFTLQEYLGGVAYMPGLCSYKYAFSAIHPTYSNVPTYSWPVEVFTHETGHNLGSPHTHACVWNGNNTAIDGCYQPEGSCPQPNPTTDPGTIMSYCHLTHYGINFAFGFGPQPRNEIVNSFNIATCLSDCGGCAYSLNPTNKNLTALGGTGAFSVTTGSACSWRAVVNAPILLNILSRSQEDNLFLPRSGPAAYLGLAREPDAPQTLYLNQDQIVIADRPSNTNPPGLGALYPSTIEVANVPGKITQVTAVLYYLNHPFADDVDVVLVGPGGQRVMLMSDAGGGFPASEAVLNFQQGATVKLPDAGQITSGTYRPTNFNSDPALEPGGVDDFPSPGPGRAVYSSDLKVFNGTLPNGTWRLYAVDDKAGNAGDISLGWGVGIITSGGSTSWININSGASGTGNGTVTYRVDANPTATQRSGTIMVNGQPYTVIQSGMDANDTTPPSVTITSHSNGQTVPTSSIILSGTATDSGRGNNGISSVTVNGARAAGDTAAGAGTAHWSLAVALNPGSNVINVVASDSRSNSTSHSITINRTSALYSISGTVKGGAVGLSGVKLTLAGGPGFTPRTFTTTGTGAYTFGNLPAGRTYMVKPSKLAYTFTPASRNFTNLSANQTPTTASFTAAPKNYRSSAVRPIPNPGTIDVPVVVTDIGVITDLNVRVRLNHTFDSDLDIYLIGPDGTTVELTTDNGGGGHNYGSGANSCASAPTVFDDAALRSITVGVAPLAGKFRPEQPLSIFNGKASNGAWKLRITDDTGQNVGALYCWELQFNQP